MAAPGGGSIAPPPTSSTCAAGLIGGSTSSGGAADPVAGGTGWLSRAAHAHVDTRLPPRATLPVSSPAGDLCPFLGRELLDVDRLADPHLVLLAAGLNHCIHETAILTTYIPGSRRSRRQKTRTSGSRAHTAG